MDMRGTRSYAAKWVILFLIFSFSFPMLGRAAEVTFPTPSYAGQELAKVREWEKTWVGKRVSTANLDQVKEFLSEGVYKAMKEPKDFGADSFWFEIVPYRPYEPTTGLIEATKKYAPGSKLDADEALINFGEGAGYPFPQPKTGSEMAWNFDCYTKGDTHYVMNFGCVVDPKTKMEREAGQPRWDTYWMCRVDAKPVPKIPAAENPRGIFHSFFQKFTAPTDFIDSSMIELRYLDYHREQDMWVYLNMFRRITRYATDQRTDTIDGTDLIYDDHDGWYTTTMRNTYKSLGRADLLVGRHQPLATTVYGNDTSVQRVNGQAFWNGVRRERVNLWVVEVVCKDKNYIYSKQIWYLDPETWQMSFKNMYNRQGQFWKMYEMFYSEYPTEAAPGQKVTYMTAEHSLDYIRHHGSPSSYRDHKIGIDIPLSQYNTAAMKNKQYR
jgi:hypothetical protein